MTGDRAAAPFQLEKLIRDVFAPRAGETLTIFHDRPHGELADEPDWRDRRAMARRWHEELASVASDLGIRVAPLCTYLATGSHSGELPSEARQDDRSVLLDEVIGGSDIVLFMTRYSASAPLYLKTRSLPHVRGASMPGVVPAMEETGLAADYREVAALCRGLEPLFAGAELIEVEFSTGHRCTFDIGDGKAPRSDTGLLPPGQGADATRLANLPAGEVFVCPDERAGSRTAGKIPVLLDDEIVVLTVRENRIVDLAGQGRGLERARNELFSEPARCNIAEVAVGCNPRAVVRGIVLEDEKAGFHWAFGRSDAMGGTVGPADFTAPHRVIHEDIVYARESPIVCARLDFVTATGERTTAIADGVLLVAPEEAT
jgi:hypothetical protein